MGISVYTSLLIKDFRRKAGSIKAVRKDLRETVKAVLEMERELAALLTVIQSRDPEFIPSSVKAISTAPKILRLPKNKLSVLVVEALKTSEVHPVHIRDITNYVIQHGQIEMENRRTYTTIHFCVKACLKRLKGLGRVIHPYNNTKDTEGLWDLAELAGNK